MTQPALSIRERVERIKAAMQRMIDEGTWPEFLAEQRARFAVHDAARAALKRIRERFHG